ncbi:hypothetical protein JHD50_04645 [Sulfurimonas sp. MAG313]|nr:hypothetical protein [Sulfurimonas sp. MAG313]MDF1880596.1 hypothetical protein [Sulfurimonas sp. MAG313]
MKNILIHTFVFTLLALNLNAETLKDFIMYEKETPQTHTQKPSAQKPFYQGEVVDVAQAQAYTYIQVKEHSNQSFWIATERADVKKGDFVRFQKELVLKNFKSKVLDKVFKEVMFASNLQHKVK